MGGAETFLGVGLYDWLISYGYPVLTLLTIVDSTYVGFFAGVLSSIHVFNVFIVFALCLVIRTITDSLVFFSARWGSSSLERFKFYRNIVKKLKDNECHTEKGKEFSSFLKRHVFKILFLAKIIPIPGFPETILVTGGILKADIKKMYLAMISGQAIWNAILISLGFYFGHVITDAKHLINVVGFTFALIAIAFFFYYRYAHQYIMTRQWFKYLFNGGNSKEPNNKEC